MTASPEYVLTFTAAGLLRVSCAQMAALRLGCGDWSLARKEGLDANLLQARTPTTGKRIWRELEARLSPLPVPALELLSNGTASQQLQILWLALCHRYALVKEFSVEILREAAVYGRQSVSVGDAEGFVHRKAQVSARLAALPLTESVRIRQVLLRLSREADLLAADGAVLPKMPDLEVVRALGAPYLPVWPAMLLTDAGLREVQSCL